MMIFLPLSSQEQIFLYFKIMFIMSTSLNLIGLMFLIKETPPNQTSIRKYLIIIQVFLMLSDIHLEIGFHPIPLFPAYAGYAVGILIQFGISTHIEWAITICFYVWIGASILVCISFRHQNIVSTGDTFKFERTTVNFFRVFLMIGQIIPVINYALNGNDSATVDRYLNVDPHNLAWIRSRGSYYMEKRSTGILLQIMLVLFVLIFGCFVGLLVFVHMFYVLHKDSAKRSSHSIRSIQRSLIALFLQLAVPFTLFVVPAVITFIGLLFQDLMSFEFMLGIFLILPWHSVGHNLMLLSITRAYRNRIVMLIKKIFMPRFGLIIASRIQQSSTFG